jgi:hypothetical protein
MHRKRRLSLMSHNPQSLQSPSGRYTTLRHNTPSRRQRIKFWLEDPTVLVRHWELWPTSGCNEMEPAQRLNIFTILVIIIAVILKVAGSKDWLWFLIGGLLLIAIWWFWSVRSDDSITAPIIERYRCPSPTSSAPTPAKRAYRLCGRRR